MFFSEMTKNLNCEISTKNLVTFKRWDGVSDENNINIYGSSLKNPIFRGGRWGGGGVHEKTIFWGGRGGVNRLKSAAWIVCTFKRGLGEKEKKKEGVMFLR